MLIYYQPDSPSSRKLLPPSQNIWLWGNITFAPGLYGVAGCTEVDEAEFQANMKNPALKAAFEVRQSGGVIRIEEGYQSITDLTVGEALERIKACSSVEQLERWRKIDNRATVEKAIAKAIEALTPEQKQDKDEVEDDLAA